jgi:hypothetical protein
VGYRPIRALALVVVWLAVVGSSVAGAAGEEIYDGRSTDDTVRMVVGGLLAIAAVTAVLTLVYIWHTSPRRRLRIARNRSPEAPAVEE